ncbi:acetate uptake transporter family protein [Streptomyces sp. TRM70350]|uniref:acetate uptake transporter family protein n=1 Tax=Streptomyces sp. TRM70350 TaxID=2856165 RepID=UPI002110B5F4|nr:GPR1/FUN34/YaaH family transporter [Streptomyces sp. TRM70350]
MTSPDHSADRSGDRNVDEGDDPDGYEAWRARSRLVLTPVAAPSILGWFAFGAATFTVASNMAEWWGNNVFSPVILAPFVIFVGGVAQLLAATWAYRARDGLATAMHGVWGGFWLAWGVLVLLTASGTMPVVVISEAAFGFWWIAAAVITLFGALAALGQNLSTFLTLVLLTAGSSLVAAGLIGNVPGVRVAAGWVLVAAGAAAFYTAGALLLEQSHSRVVLPLGRWGMRGNVPGHKAIRDIGYPDGMPGAKPGQ